jgi:transposase
MKRADRRAATSGPASHGQTEGHVTCLYLIKSEMDGRAKFNLLGLRVIPAA